MLAKAKGDYKKVKALELDPTIFAEKLSDLISYLNKNQPTHKKLETLRKWQQQYPLAEKSSDKLRASIPFGIEAASTFSQNSLDFLASDSLNGRLSLEETSSYCSSDFSSSSDNNSLNEEIRPQENEE